MTASLLPATPVRSAAARRPLRSGAADVLITVAAVIVGATVALWWSDEIAGPTSAEALGRLAGLLGTLALLALVGVIARIPFLEREIGQDVLLYWHRKIAPYVLLLLGGHAVLITIGYAETTRSNPIGQAWKFLIGYPDMLKAMAGFGLFLAAGVVSWRRIRRLMNYETWWVSHLFTYIAAFLVFGHQFSNGNSFLAHPLASVAWKTLYLGVFSIVVWCRLVVPVARSIRGDVRIQRVERVNSDAVHVILAGRSLDRLNVQGGQFLQFRFLTKDLWWQAHPYSPSAKPVKDAMRITVQVAGDASRMLARLAPGTRVLIEGPYGAFTLRRATTNRLVMVAGGIGITPIRSLLEDLPAGSQPVVLYRVGNSKDLVLQRELDELVSQRSGVIHYLVGSRQQQPMTGQRLQHLVPDLAERDLFICGSRGLIREVTSAALQLGLPKYAIHAERFDFE